MQWGEGALQERERGADAMQAMQRARLMRLRPILDARAHVTG